MQRITSKSIPWAFIPLVFALLPELDTRIALGSVNAADIASNSAYAADPTGAWKGLNPTVGENPPGNDNGGFGFQTWDFAGGYQDPMDSPYGNLNHFIDGVDFAASSFNQLGSPAFGLTTGNRPYFPYTARATRSFVTPLTVGQTVSVDFDNPLLFPQAFAAAGFLFRLNTGGGPYIAGSTTSLVKNRLDVFTNVQRALDNTLVGGNWTVTDGDTSFESFLAPSDTAVGSKFAFTLTGPETYSLKISRLSDGANLLTRTGSLENPGTGGVDSLEIAIYGNGSGNGLMGGAAQPTGQHEFFFNNLKIESPSILVGDYNINGVVDAADYVVWRNTLGQSVAAGTGADGNNSGAIDPGDYDLWRSAFSSSMVGASSDSQSIPEPGTSVLIAIAIGFGICIVGRVKC